MTTEAPEWLSPTEAANLLGISSNRVRQLADAGKLVAERSPLGRLISRASVEQLREEREA